MYKTSVTKNKNLQAGTEKDFLWVHSLRETACAVLGVKKKIGVSTCRLFCLGNSVSDEPTGIHWFSVAPVSVQPRARQGFWGRRVAA